jgi:glycosyltransferase involved in cell wall biosynthesis
MLWVTNMPAPYRLPILDLLGEIYELDVYFLLGEKNWRDWNLRSDNRSWSFKFLNLRTIVFKDFEFVLGLGLKIEKLSQYDVIILGSWENLVYLRLMHNARKFDKLVIPIYESHSKSQKFNKGIIPAIRAFFYRNANMVVTFGPASSRAICEMGIESKKILELFNLVDNAWFQSSLNRNLDKLKVGHTYLFVGRLIEQKNIETAIHAFSQIAEADDRLRIVGDGPRLKFLKALAQTLQVGGQVDFLGFQDPSELVKIFNNSHTLVLPSRTEVWGLVVNEALACGLHVVVSNQAGVAESIEGQEGVYLATPDTANFAQGMERSKVDWNGWIKNPAINAFSKDNFVQQLVERIEVELSE